MKIKLLVLCIFVFLMMVNACSTTHHNTPEAVQKGEHNILIYKSPGAVGK